MKTKKELEAQGWLFITADGGAKIATNHKLQKRFVAMTVATLRAKIERFFNP